MKFNSALVLALSGAAFAHPGHPETVDELSYKRSFNAQSRRGLNACSEKLEKRGATSRMAERRALTYEKHRKASAMVSRDTDTIANTTHLSNSTYTPATPDATIFAESNTCIAAPEGEVGPYWVKGEYNRYDLQEGQPGVPIIIEAQILDLETCEPLIGAWWDVWNCNSTGVYGGVVEEGNGNIDDLANLNATFLRGIQKVDNDGVASFKTIFPGHYTGRATHTHMIVYLNGTPVTNNTVSAGAYAHVGQLFWDQDLITRVEATYPYNTNNITITENSVDHVFTVETEDTTTDPVFEYVQLGDDLSDGLFGWITIVVNSTATFDPSYSYALTEEGGVAETGGEDSAVTGGGDMTGGGEGGNSTSGAPPAK